VLRSTVGVSSGSKPAPLPSAPMFPFAGCGHGRERRLSREAIGRRFPPPWHADKMPGGYAVRMPRAASICDSQSLAVERFQRDLLRQHDVAGSQFAFRQEAPVTSGVNFTQNQRFEFPYNVVSPSSPDPVEDATVLGPIKAKPCGWPRRRGQP
jgi:hypothetical protein